MKQINFNGGNWRNVQAEIVEAEYRIPTSRDYTENFSRKNSNDEFVVPLQSQQNYNQRRASNAYGADNLKTKLDRTRQALIDSRATYDSNSSLPHPWGMNQLALA